MTGALEERADELAAKFNAAQSSYTVVPVYKGGHAESTAAAIAAARAGRAPAILQMFEISAASMIAGKKMTLKPIHEVMTQAGEKLDPKSYLPGVIGYHSDTHGRMLSLPLNRSTPLFFYNKDAFLKANLDPDTPPKTWDEMQEAALKLQASGAACAYTTAWQAWVQLENMSAWHNQEFATKRSGPGSSDIRLVFNNRLLVRHVARLSSWVKSGLFTYAGRAQEAEARFHAGDCAMLTGSSAAYADIKRHAKFKFGVSALPYYDDVRGAPHNATIDGASLWVMAGRTAAEYRGVAKFFSFLSAPEIQADWHQKTGHVPITKAAYELTRKQGFYATHPGADVAVRQLLLKHPTRDSKALRVGSLVQVRGIIDEELESIWDGRKSPKQALDDAVERGNAVLRELERASKTGLGAGADPAPR